MSSKPKYYTVCELTERPVLSIRSWHRTCPITRKSMRFCPFTREASATTPMTPTTTLLYRRRNGVRREKGEEPTWISCRRWRRRAMMRTIQTSKSEVQRQSDVEIVIIQSSSDYLTFAFYGTLPNTDFPAYIDTGYSDSFDRTQMACYISTLMWLEWHLLTLTLFSCPEGVPVSGEDCSHQKGPYCYC